MHPTWPSLSTQASPGACAWPYHGRCGRPCRGHSGRVAGPQPCHVAGAPLRRVVAWLAVSRHSSLISSPILVTIQLMYCDANAQQSGSPCHDIINCIVTFTFCLSSLLLYHNTIGVLRHNPSLANLHSRTPKSRYNPFCHDTNSASPRPNQPWCHDTMIVS